MGIRGSRPRPAINPATARWSRSGAEGRNEKSPKRVTFRALSESLKSAPIAVQCTANPPPPRANSLARRTILKNLGASARPKGLRVVQMPSSLTREEQGVRRNRVVLAPLQLDVEDLRTSAIEATCTAIDIAFLEYQ